MGVFIFVTLRLFHGGVLEVESGEPRYVGGVMTEYVNVDVDTLSYFELVDYIKELGYSSSCTFTVRPPNCGIIENINNDRELSRIAQFLQNGAFLEVYVQHMGVVEPGSAFNKGDETIEASASQNIEVGEEALNGAAATSPTPTDPAAPPVASPLDPDPDSSSTEEESDKSSEDSSSDEDSDFFSDGIEDYGSDIHEEFIEFRAERKSFQRRKRKERAPADPKNVPCAARHKTIITTLEEIRVKMMTRIATLREFANTWSCNISPMALKVLEENIEKSMRCTLFFNGETGYQVKEGTNQHTVCLRNNTCSCRAWMLKGIPCPHAIAAMYYKGYEPADYVDNCYMKETYLMTYSHFLQPLNNMEMWPASTNPPVAPPVVKSMPGRPKKVRRKEATETKKCGKLLKTGLVMRCSICKGVGHNKRGCHKSATDPLGSRTAFAPSNITSTAADASGSGRNRGRPKKPRNVEDEPAAKRGRGRPRKSTSTAPNASIAAEFSSSITSTAPIATSAAASRGRGRGRGREGPNATSAAPNATSAAPNATSAAASRGRGRGRGREGPNATSAAPNATSAAASRGRGRGGSWNATHSQPNTSAAYHSLASWFECSARNTSSSPNASAVPNASTATLNRGRGKGVENTKQFKRPRVMGMGVFQAENGFKTLNPGMASSRIVATPSTRIEPTGPTMITMSADVTGDIGFKPSSGLKWKGKPAITTRRLQEIRGQHRIQTRTGGSNNLSQNSSSAHPQ
ncbi:hypothetical protein A4A49_41426 [Nicotiana attenuata]|uniref:SWIM-type domain-containing protein n=1 Tax=Nicotiana attenuata TaxID=49451 RepID=A0A314KH74_NICAT|nr:hypothetical protein A4A49_41426 [Nicotiana attenuata]